MKNLVFLFYLFTLINLQGQNIFEITNEKGSNSVKVKANQKIHIKQFNEKNSGRNYIILACKEDTLFTKDSFILIHNIEYMEFIKNTAQPSIASLLGRLLMLGSPLVGINNGKFVPKLSLICLGIGSGITSLTYLYYKDAGLQRFNLYLEKTTINPL